MARRGRGKDKHPRKKKPVCSNGHDISIVGRNKHGQCNICVKEYAQEYLQRLKSGTYTIKHTKQFCPKGHDTFECGRRNNGRCETCCLMDDRDGSHNPLMLIQFCSQGHDTFITGRNRKGNCVVCVPILQQEYNMKYWEDHKEELAKANKEYQENHREEINEMHKKWKEENKDHYKEVTDKWRKENKEQINAQKNVYNKEKLKSDVAFKISRILRGRLRQAIKNNYKAGSAVRNLGCTVEFFKKYIENMFHGDMTWENHGSYWHLDHIKELWEFDLEDPVQFKQAVHYTNLQPLTIPEHKEKTAKERLRRESLK